MKNLYDALDNQYHAQLEEIVQELELMTDRDAEISAGVVIDSIDCHIRHMIAMKGQLRNYFSNRRTDLDVLRTVLNRYDVM